MMMMYNRLSKHIIKPKADGFGLIKWASNSSLFLSNIPNENLTGTEMGPSGVNCKPQKILGIPFILREEAI